MSSANKTKNVISREIGPIAECRQVVWARLSDFAAWPDLLPALRQIDISETKSPGRGSTLQLHWHDHMDVAQITHWHPGHQIEWVIQEKSRRIGVRLVLGAADDHQHIKVVMEAELEQQGPFSLFHSFIAERIALSLKQQFEPLFTAF